MIDKIFLHNFKNFRSELLRLGRFTVIVGANASGKSNIRDAFRILNGIGNGYGLSEIFGGKYNAGQMIWKPIRGAPDEIYRQGSEFFQLSVELSTSKGKIEFQILVRSHHMSESNVIGLESVRINSRDLYQWNFLEGFKGHSPEANDNALKIISRDKAILNQLDIFKDSEYCGELIDSLSNVRFLDPVPDRMRQPSLPGQRVLGDSGENLPSILNMLCADELTKKTLIEWIRELTPMDIEDIEFPPDPSGRIHLIVKERDGRKVSAFSASDGTLRFLGMLAALLTPNPPRLYFFEEIENGVHPSRLRLLVDLIETQTVKGNTQVVATTHSPELLSIVNEETFQYTSVVCRREGTSDAIIRPVSGIPNAVELRKSQGLGRLLAGGWMETALAFSQDDEDGEETPG